MGLERAVSVLARIRGGRSRIWSPLPPNLRARTAAAALLAAAAILIAGCEGPLPEKDSFPARLYAQRCDGCHRAYNPHRMTAAMWEIQVGMMEPKIREAGLPPLTPEERKIILDYLQRNAGTQ